MWPRSRCPVPQPIAWPFPARALSISSVDASPPTVNALTSGWRVCSSASRPSPSPRSCVRACDGRAAVRGLKAWRARARLLKGEVIALSFAVRHPRVPWYAKVVAACVVAYALSPIDLIPDFIPVLGYLDDLVLVPLGVALVIRDRKSVV